MEENKTVSKNILVVEDSQVVQNITKHVLEFQNHKVTTALNGEIALDLIKENDYDIILMDLAMPKLNGLDCVKMIREMKEERKSTVPVIAVTGNAEFYSETEFKKAGFDWYLEKPIDFDSIAKVIKDHSR